MDNLWKAHSYSSRDARAAELVAQLRQADPKLDLFYAPDSLRAGTFWTPRLAEELDKANACVVLVGEGQPGSWQLIEYYAAFDRQTTDPSFLLVPVVLSQSVSSFPFITLIHWISVAGLPAVSAAAQILDALKGKLEDQPAAFKLINPFHDLESLDEGHADLFFGRAEETDETIQAFADQPSKAVVLVGNSGVGKSSLAIAGVIAGLRRQRFAAKPQFWPRSLQTSREWLFLTMRPTEDPVDALVNAFCDQWELDPTSAKDKSTRNEWIEKVSTGKLSVRDLIDATLARFKQLDRPIPSGVLLYVDQGEELYRSGSTQAPGIFPRSRGLPSRPPP